MAAPDPDTQVRAGHACSTTCCCTRRSSARRRCCSSRRSARRPDLLVGCTGGGSNFGGLAFPFLREKLAGRMNPVIRAVEPASCPSLTRGEYALRLRRHRRDDAADEDAHARPRLRPGPDPRRRPALPRHVAADLARLRARADGGHRHPADRVLRRGHHSSPAPRASCRRPSRPTRWPRASGRPWPARSPARRRSSSPRCAATATSTWPPTTPTSPAGWSTRTSPTTSSPPPSPRSRPWRRGLDARSPLPLLQSGVSPPSLIRRTSGRGRPPRRPRARSRSPRRPRPGPRPPRHPSPRRRRPTRAARGR